MVINTSYEWQVKAARLLLNVSCDQPEESAETDPLSPVISCLFHPEDNGGGGTTCAPGETVKPVFIVNDSLMFWFNSFLT